MARLSFALPALARCERPRNASVRACRLQPGRLAQGPDEKCGVTGRTPGLVVVIWSILPDGCPSVGKGVPQPRYENARGASSAPRVVQVRVFAYGLLDQVAQPKAELLPGPVAIVDGAQGFDTRMGVADI